MNFRESLYESTLFKENDTKSLSFLTLGRMGGACVIKHLAHKTAGGEQSLYHRHGPPCWNLVISCFITGFLR